MKTVEEACGAAHTTSLRLSSSRWRVALLKNSRQLKKKRSLPVNVNGCSAESCGFLTFVEAAADPLNQFSFYCKLQGSVTQPGKVEVTGTLCRAECTNCKFASKAMLTDSVSLPLSLSLSPSLPNNGRNKGRIGEEGRACMHSPDKSPLRLWLFRIYRTYSLAVNKVLSELQT